MHQLLRPHPESRSSAAEHVEVVVTQSQPEKLVLAYRVTGKIRDIFIPPVTRAKRTDELWRHTCFEAFVRGASGNEYYEFNFAPSTQWAAYRFNGYRSGMCVTTEVDAPPIDIRSHLRSFTLQTALELNRLSVLPRDAPWHLALSAVIEETDGNKSYWALVHPPGKPDFHHRDSFAYELSPAVHP
jgi:hypothetical protein